MIQRNSTLAVLRESFVAGSDENLSPIMHHLWKMEGGAIYFCRSGWAHVTIDLKEYEIVKNTQVVLLPGSIIRINGSSSDFTASFFGFPKDMFREACLRLEPTFFRFMKERPCYVLPDKDTVAINGLIQAATAIYNDRENRFRNQIAKNHLQSFMLDIYDKCYRYFDKQEIEGGSRQDEIFKKFVALVHENCISQREVNFYANELCISTKYLTGICRSVTGDSAKKIIDDFAILEIKVLLQSTELTMQDIADRLGFPDQSYLGRYFKRHEGMSPREYQNRYYARWAIIDKNANCAIGTIELFNRRAKDYFNNCGLLRLDLRSDYEKQDTIEDILGIIIPETRDMFACEMIATKAVSIAQERIQALEHMGFCLSEEALIGHDGTKYNSYYVREV